MKILIDIGHPAHVHYFKNLIKIMESKGHEFLVVARDKEVSLNLLHIYGINFKSRGKGPKSLIGKLLYAIKANIFIFKQARKWKPDILLSFGSPYAAHISKIIGKPHIALTDTEHARLIILAFAPFTETIITPDCYFNKFIEKQIRFNGYFELSYLAPKYFTPNQLIKQELNINKNQKVVLFRFISWGASHDIGQSGISLNNKNKLTELFINKSYKVLISAEGELSPDLEPFRIKISPEKIHDVLSAVDIFIGESGTMATEAAILGTPSVYFNSLDAGVFQDEVKYGLLYSFRESTNIIEDVENLLKIHNLKSIHSERRIKFLSEKIDTTAFLVWFIEDYPNSRQIMKLNPDYQFNFKQ
jgi:predicted glycosyltransferase